MSFIDQVITYRLLKDAISPQTWLMAISRRIQRLKQRGQMRPVIAAEVDEMLTNLAEKYITRGAFTPGERKLLPIFTRYINAATKPNIKGLIPIEARTPKEFLSRMRASRFRREDFEELRRTREALQRFVVRKSPLRVTRRKPTFTAQMRSIARRLKPPITFKASPPQPLTKAVGQPGKSFTPGISSLVQRLKRIFGRFRKTK